MRFPAVVLAQIYLCGTTRLSLRVLLMAAEEDFCPEYRIIVKTNGIGPFLVYAHKTVVYNITLYNVAPARIVFSRRRNICQHDVLELTHQLDRLVVIFEFIRL